MAYWSSNQRTSARRASWLRAISPYRRYMTSSGLERVYELQDEGRGLQCLDTNGRRAVAVPIGVKPPQGRDIEEGCLIRRARARKRLAVPPSCILDGGRARDVETRQFPRRPTSLLRHGAPHGRGQERPLGHRLELAKWHPPAAWKPIRGEDEVPGRACRAPVCPPPPRPAARW